GRRPARAGHGAGADGTVGDRRRGRPPEGTTAGGDDRRRGRPPEGTTAGGGQLALAGSSPWRAPAVRGGGPEGGAAGRATGEGAPGGFVGPRLEVEVVDGGVDVAERPLQRTGGVEGGAAGGGLGQVDRLDGARPGVGGGEADAGALLGIDGVPGE